MNNGIKLYNEQLCESDKEICALLVKTINAELSEGESKIWHSHPVWFLDGNPVVGYNKLKDCIRLLFWSGQSFESEKLKPTGSFKAAEIRYSFLAHIDLIELNDWLKKSRQIQWDYKNLIRRKGKLERLK